MPSQRAFQVLAAAAVLTLALAGCGGSKNAETTTAPAAVAVGQPVPPAMRAAIRRHAGIYAYVPTWMPAGYRASSWVAGPGLGIRFERNGDPTTEIVFSSGAKQYGCPGGKTVWLRGGKIYWSGNNENDQYAWICVTHHGHLVQLLVSANPSKAIIPEGSGGGPSVRTLGRILHSARPLN